MSVPQENKNYIVFQSCQQVIDRGNGSSSSRLLAQHCTPTWDARKSPLPAKRAICRHKKGNRCEESGEYDEFLEESTTTIFLTKRKSLTT